MHDYHHNGDGFYGTYKTIERGRGERETASMVHT
jgi:hypothetical protein